MQVSVIIAGNGRRTPLARCVESLIAQDDGHLQILIAFGGHPSLNAALGVHAAATESLSFEAPTALHVLRAAALQQATGEIIAILDPYSIPAPDWLAMLQSAHRSQSNQAIGGPVDLDDAEKRGLLDWAVYINEYGMFLPPMEKQAMELLPGCNVSYKRTALFEGAAPRSPELWKTFVNDRLRELGEDLLIEPGMIVALDKTVDFGDYLYRRYDHGRCYGAMSSREMSIVARLLRVVAAPVLPFLLLARWSRRYWLRGRFRGRLIATLPLQLLMFGWWIAGETVGRLFGAGRSCSRLYY